jgi:hypothetical protein
MTDRVFTIRFVSGPNVHTRSISGNNVISFSILGFIDVLNQLLVLLTQDLGQPQNAAPYFTWDENTGKFYLIVSFAITNELDFIDVNRDVHFFMAGFPFIKLPDGFYRLHIRKGINDNFYYISPRYNNSGIPLAGIPPTQFNSYKIASEFNTDYRFNLLQSVVVLSNIPVRQETLPLATQNAVVNQSNPLSYIASLPILNDFRGLIERYGDQNSNLLYVNQGEFRWMDLISDKPLDRLSFDFRWQRTDQSLEQLLLEPGESISIKIYFRSIR